MNSDFANQEWVFYRIFRKEYFHLTPSFQLETEPKADEMILVEDLNFGSDNERFNSTEEALDNALNQIRIKFDL